MNLLAGCLTALTLTFAVQTSDPAALVRQLGDGSFEVRVAADLELTRLGLAALPALEAGLRNPDIEIRTRCEALLVRVREADRKARVQAFLDEPADREPSVLPGWSRYRTLAGMSATKKAFIAVFQTDPDLMDRAGRDPRAVAASMQDRCRQLGVRLLLPQKEGSVAAELPALLFVASDPAVPLEKPALDALYVGLKIVAEREAAMKELFSHAGMAEMLFAILQRGGEASHAVTVPLAGTLKLPTARTWGKWLVREAKAPAGKAEAMLLLARVGKVEDVAALKPLLDDKTSVGSVTVAGQVLQTELRDVALAVSLVLSGEKPEDYGFPYFEKVPGLKTLPSPERLGFVTPATRDAALAKWRAKGDK